MTGPIYLSTQPPFARGGHRECYVDPRDPGRCIKVRRPDYPLTALRRDKGFPKNLKPLSAFDDNREEYRVLSRFQSIYGEHAFAHIGRCFGFVDTDLGPGLVIELIRNGDGGIARTLKETLWQEGLSDALAVVIGALIEHWQRLCLPSRHLLLHNIVVQRDRDNHPSRLVVIDGLGSPTVLPFHWLPPSLQRRRVRKKTRAFEARVEALLALRHQQSHFPGEHGQLLHRDQPENRP